MHFKWGLYIPSKFTFTKCVSNTVFDEAILLFSMNIQPTKAVLSISSISSTLNWTKVKCENRNKFKFALVKLFLKC